MELSLLFENILIYLPTIISGYYIYLKGTQIKISIRKIFTLFLYLIPTIFLPIIIQNYNYIFARFIFIFLFIITCFIISRNHEKKIKFFISTISLGTTYCLRMISMFITSIIFSVCNYYAADLITETFVAFLQIFLSISIIRTKRYSKCFLYIQNDNNYGFGLFLSSLSLLIASIISKSNLVSKPLIFIYAMGLIVSAFGLFLWIRKSITDHYRNKLQAKADEHYQNTLNEKEHQIEQLNNSNAFLSKVVHRDNHLMSALQHTISEYKSCDNKAEKEKLLNEILTLAEERNDLIVKEQTNSKILPTTGLSIIDGALSNMYIKASAHNIEFNLIVNQDIHYLVNNLITQTDLETLLCDHIKDAIIAIASDDNIKGRILITITMNDDIYEISIKDNGIDFETDTLAKLGRERITTHKETGGSGIGFITTFETLKKSKASLIVTEYKTRTPFSKSITFRFDGLDTFIIKSNRADLLRQTINRNDVIILEN